MKIKLLNSIIANSGSKRIMILLMLYMGLFFTSCRDYLDVVPDNTLTLDDIFSVKEEAYNALAKVYSYMPREDRSDLSSYMLGDEFVGRLRYNTRTDRLRGIAIMRGLQSVGDPRLGRWCDNSTEGTKSLYQAISVCNIFIDKIDMVHDMDDLEKADWKAQAKFMKAYYHFLLLQKYGPIVISDKQTSAEATSEELFPFRSKVDDCFDYIVRVMDEAIPDLLERRTSIDFGQVDKMVASAIKARVLVFRASPFYSGNREFYEDFLDRDGKPFFPVDDDAAKTKAKWKDAVDAIDEAIEICEKNGKGLYTFDKAVYPYDEEDFELNKETLQTYYDLRMVVADPWNKELVWGYSNLNITSIGTNFPFQNVCNIQLPVGYTPGTTNSNTGSEMWMAATFKMLDRYYTANGLPLEEDRTFNRNTRYNLVFTPAEDAPEYQSMRGIMQPDVETINLYLNRELRFYANLGITGGYWRSHAHRIMTTMYAYQAGGYKTDEYNLCTGIGVQKLVHPESKSGDWRRFVRFPYPIIRMADLYLMKAEAMNEYLDVPNEQVWDPINKVRFRAGIPGVQAAWGSSGLVKPEYLNKHASKSGMRDIILKERSIELAFEGVRFWDMVRHKRATAEFSTPIFGWSVMKETGSDFFVVEMKEDRSFQDTYYLWPIDLSELNTNSNLVQNPGY